MEDTKYRLGIVDEYERDIDKFHQFFEDDFEVVEITLAPTAEETVQNIIDSHVDAVAIDYKLKEYNQVEINYLGNTVYDLLQERLHDFPSFLLTSYAPDADKETLIDTFKIISRSCMNPTLDVGRRLIEQVKAKIAQYRTMLTDSETRLLELIEKQKKEPLDAVEEQEMIELDEFLEKSLAGKSNIPMEWKRSKALETLNHFATMAEEILQQLKKQQNDKV
jgi:DNA-binding NarL/FixJ family response regulator